MKLLPMTEFVLEFRNKCESMEHYVDTIENYANFLKQPLELGMFVPVDEEGNVLEEPSDYDYYVSDNEQCFNGDTDECLKYVEAKEKVLFEGFHYVGNDTVTNDNLQLSIDVKIFQFMQVGNLGLGGGDIGGLLLDNLAICDLGIELTPSALKQIGL